MFANSNTLKFHPFRASVIKKQLMAVTGLMMCGFLLVHLAGNLLIFKGPEIFNQFAFQMLTNPIIAILEWMLVFLFLGHALMGVLLIVENRRARPIAYGVRLRTNTDSNLSLVSMSITGPLLFLFLIMHLIDFKFGPEYYVQQGGIQIRDLHRTVMEYFQNPFNVVLYSLAMCLMALHVQHGFWSAFQSFGLNHPRYNKLLKVTANIYAIVILLGFVAIPLSFVEFGGS